MPGKRAQLAVEKGAVDGEVMRIYTYGGEVPNVVRVEPAYFYLDTTPYVKKGSGIQINAVDDLRNYRIAKVRGVKHTSNITAGMDRVYDLDSAEQVIKFLEYGRADVAIGNSLNLNYLLKEMKNEDVVAAGPPLARLPLYHYLTKKHSRKAAKVGKMISGMQQSGKLERLIQEAEYKIFQAPGEAHYKH
ncbi:transporter substrate-binding domain-containing protein [Desulfovibrio sp. JC010]|uniref:substrate-binding periplasmic protein n=1 Tax=Desulfovibrio sp. JC010 TaxID=2593641 RepID=UPI0013D89AD5|nr:transporter substrate-binding domain-containing protein [Desulfovibrio sp. JC010]